MFDDSKSVVQQINFDNPKGIQLFLKREDLIHPDISGNKYRKLKYNIKAAMEYGHETVLTFGGAFSNHIAAMAAAGKIYNFKTIGIIRGEELATNYKSNPTLSYAVDCGMKLKFVSRKEYREKDSEYFIEKLKEEFGRFYLIPEGGTNLLAVKGCEEIMDASSSEYDYICCPVGTGGTVSGLINCSKPIQQILGFSALKGDFLKDEIAKFAKSDNWRLMTDYHFGGYAKVSKELIFFMNDFKLKYGIQLDPIYTGKMMFGIIDLIKNDFFKSNVKILAIHTGGLQGIVGINKSLRKKKLPIIK